MLAFKDNNDGYYQFDWDGVSPLPEWTKRLTQIEVIPRDHAVVAAENKTRSIATINAIRDAKLSAGFTHNGTLWHCDHVFQSQVQGFVLAYVTGVLSPTATVTVRAKDDALHLRTFTELTALAEDLLAHVQGIYDESWAAKDALMG